MAIREPGPDELADVWAEAFLSAGLREPDIEDALQAVDAWREGCRAT